MVRTGESTKKVNMVEIAPEIKRKDIQQLVGVFFTEFDTVAARREMINSVTGEPYEEDDLRKIRQQIIVEIKEVVDLSDENERRELLTSLRKAEPVLRTVLEGGVGREAISSLVLAHLTVAPTKGGMRLKLCELLIEILSE